MVFILSESFQNFNFKKIPTLLLLNIPIKTDQICNVIK